VQAHHLASSISKVILEVLVNPHLVPFSQKGSTPSRTMDHPGGVEIVALAGS
jgi:hypothetical protein